jgi:hypothetical protein
LCRLAFSRTNTAPRIAAKSFIDEIEKQGGRGATLNLARNDQHDDP